MDPEGKEEKKAIDAQRDGDRVRKKFSGKLKGTFVVSVAMHAIISMIKILLIVCLITGLYESGLYILEGIRAEDQPEVLLEELDVDDLEDIVEIKGNSTVGYYYSYKEGFEEKLEELAERTKKEHNLPSTSVETIEKMIRAQLVNQFPNLGGAVGQASSNGTLDVELMLEKAQAIANYARENSFTYGNAMVNPAIDKTEKVVSCDRFVGWVLYDMGFTNQPQEHGYVLGNIEEFLKECGFEKITKPDEYLAGDIVFTRPDGSGNPQHVFICAGNGKKQGSYLRYDMGSDNRISSQQPFDEPITQFAYLYRMTEKKDEEKEDEEEYKSPDFQGNIKIRRVSPDKEIGEYKDISGGIISTTNSESVSSDGLGTKQDIPDDIKQKMEGVSMKGLSGTTYDDLSYLTIPYYDFNGNVTTGHMVVNKKLADEVLLIFQELFNIKYPIERMELVDNYNASDYESIEANNTSAFNDRTVAGTGTVSNHAKGQAIDINPQINPYINADGTYSHTNAAEYVKNRDSLEGWSGKAKEAVINKNSEIYKIFTKYGWYWLGDGACNGDSDTQHFEKTNLSDVKKIDPAVADASKKTNDDKKEDGSSKGVIVLDPGHGKSLYGMSGSELAQNGFIQNSSGAWGEWRHWKTGTYGEECGGSGCNGESDCGDEWYLATTGDRDTEPTVNLNNAMAAKKYLEEMGYTVRMTRTDNNTHPSFAQRSTYCFPNQDTSKEPDADLYVCIHSNAFNGSASGTSYIATGGAYTQKYIPSDYSNKCNTAGDIINKKVAEASGLKENAPIGGETDLIAFHKNPCPTAYLEIGFFDNASDLSILQQKSDDIGRAIANGVNEYMGSPAASIDYSIGSSDNVTQSSSSVKSRIYDLSYVSEDEFNEYVENNNQMALKTFTLNEDGKLITAKWGASSQEGVKIYKNSPINFKTVMLKYIITYEYILDYWIDIKEEAFIDEFIDKIIDSEFIIAVEDNVTTKNITETTSVTSEYSGSGLGTSVEKNFTEMVSDKIELTYVDTWFVNVSKNYSFSTATIQSSTGSGEMLSGTKGTLLGSYIVTGYCPCYECSEGYGTSTSTGAVCTANRTIAVDPSDIPYGTKVIIEGLPSVYVAEDCGGGVKGKHIDVYVENHADTFVIGNDHRNVWLAEDVQSAKATYDNPEYSNNIIRNAIANVPGKVTVSNSQSTSVSTDTKEVEVYVSLAPGVTVKQTVLDTITTTVVTDTNIIANKYDTGEDYNVVSKEDEFIELFDRYPEAKLRVKPKWLVRCIEKNAGQMVDLTKYLMNVLMDEKIFPNIDKSKIFDRYKNNEFKTVSKHGKISYETLTITEEDKQILYKITSAERGDGTQEQQEYVVSVILNRVLSSEFPNTVKDVVFAPMQFEPTRNGAYDAAQPSDVTIAAVDNVVENGGTAGTALYFMTPAASLTQDWLADCIFLFNDEDDSLKDTNTSGTHNFYTSKKGQEELQQYMIAGSGDIIEACEEVMNMLIDRGAVYPLNENWDYLTPAVDIDKQLYDENEKNFCCATYVAAVLYHSGVLTEDQINPFNYHWTGEDDGIPAMLLAAGWTEITDRSDLQPGDVLNNPGEHVAIYAGDGLVYDQSCAVYNSSRTKGPEGRPVSRTYPNDPSYKIYRAP